MSSTSMDTALGNLSLRMLFSSGSPVSVLHGLAQLCKTADLKSCSTIALEESVRIMQTGL